MGSSIVKIILILVAVIVISFSKCQNSTENKYDLTEPVQITHYHATCSQYTKRTCCSNKNLDSLVKKIKKATQSSDMSITCKSALSQIMCSACDGDWGEGFYDGLCHNQCFNIFQNCRSDYFVVENANKLRPCKQQDYFCWKLQEIASHYKLNVKLIQDRVKICSFFNLIGSKHQGDCWNGQVSSQHKGKGKKKINYTSRNKKRGVGKSFFQQYKKQLIYFSVIAFLFGIVFYKWFRTSNPHYHRLT